MVTNNMRTRPASRMGLFFVIGVGALVQLSSITQGLSSDLRSSRLKGTVVGPQGERISKASVVIDARNKKCALQANELGEFELDLAPGSYTLSIHPFFLGFKGLTFSNLQVSGTHQLNQDFLLEYGRCSDCFWRVIEDGRVDEIPRVNEISQDNPEIKPPVILSRPEPSYSDLARQHKIEGRVVLDVLLSSSGKILSIHADEELPYGLTQNAITAAREIRFLPGVFRGKPITMYYPLTYDFSWRSVPCSSLAN